MRLKLIVILIISHCVVGYAGYEGSKIWYKRNIVTKAELATIEDALVRRIDTLNTLNTKRVNTTNETLDRINNKTDSLIQEIDPYKVQK